MRLEESAPAEFLFGHLNVPPGRSKEDIGPTINPMLADVLYVVISILYVLFVLLFQYYVLNFEFGPLPLLGIITSILGLIFIAGLKSQVAIKRYGPDLVKRSRGVTRFMLTQIVMAYLLSFFILFFIAVLIWKNQAQDSPITLMLAGLIALLIYTRGISDIGLITAGLGIGIFPSWGGLKHSVRNIQLITGVNGVKENHLAVLRLGLWIFIYSMLIVDQVISLMMTGTLLFVILFVMWERKNGASILMKIRGIIQELSPSDLPLTPADFDLSSEPIELKEPNKLPKRGLYDLIKRRKQPRLGSILPRKSDDLVPVAAKSINKIVDKIRMEDRGTKMYCKSCKKEMETDSRICIHCSDPLEFVADSSI